MNFELQALTAPGRRLVTLAEEHAADFATRADQHDRENTFVAENFEAMKQSGFFGACAPEEFGGIGVDSVHDLTVAISRLARGCPSTAISANMHMAGVLTVTRGWRQAQRTGDAATAALMQGFLPALGQGTVVTSGAGTERGSILGVPFTEATPTEGGYLINGHKLFATNSEVADALAVFLRAPGDDGQPYFALAVVRRGSAGMEVKGNWDALGMRGSGSHDVVFKDCFVPAPMVTVLNPLGSLPASGLATSISTNYPLVGAFLGIAESARDYIVEQARTRKKKPFASTIAERPATQVQVAEMEVALTAARAALGRTGVAIDEWLTQPEEEMEMSEATAVMSEFQCTKLIVNRAACDVVDRAMTVSGGSGYLTDSPLSRLYRDVRAGAFMQPFSPNEAFEFIGRVSLGLDPYAEVRAAVEAMKAEG
ncbi:MAG: acyl-CoA dehydrogenase family protein [Dehalococcoidia bacterium]